VFAFSKLARMVQVQVIGSKTKLPVTKHEGKHASS